MPLPIVLTREPERKEGTLRLLGAVLRHGMRKSRRADDSDFEGLPYAKAADAASVARPSVYHNADNWRNTVLRAEPGPLALRPGLGYAIGIDFGRLHDTRVMLTDIHGCEIATLPPDENAKDHLPEEAPGDAIRTAVTYVEALIDAHPHVKGRVVGVGISLPGPLNAQNRPFTEMAGDWRDEDAVPRVADALGWKQSMFATGNDAYLSAIAEHFWGVGHSEHLVYIKWASDLHAALILNGELYEGFSGTAGELPHVAVTAEDLFAVGDPRRKLEELPTCDWTACGLPGCVHGLTQVEHLGERAGDVRFRAQRIIEKAVDNPVPMAALRLAARAIGRAAAPYVAALNPELVVLGGAVGGRAYEFVSGDLMTHLKPNTRHALPIVVRGAALQRRTAVKGAAALALLEFAPGHLRRLTKPR